MAQNWAQISNSNWTFFEFYLLIYIDNNENSNNVTSLRKLKYFFKGNDMSTTFLQHFYNKS